MKAIFFIPREKYGSVKGIVEGDETLTRQSLTFRDNASLNLPDDGYYLEIEGSEEAIKLARKLLKEYKELKGKDFEKVSKAVEEQEEKAEEGFGAIFG